MRTVGPASIVAALCLVAFPASAGAACKAKQIALTRAKTHWCLPRPPLASTQAGATVQVARWLGSGELSPKALQRRVPRMPARAERAFARARDAQLTKATSAAQAARAGSRSESQGPIAPGPGQAGTGYGSEGTTTSTAEDAEHATVRTTHTSKLERKAFGPVCPDFDGNVVTRISMVLSDIRSTERRGRKTIVDTEAKVTGTLSGGFTDDFEYRGPLQLALDFVIETRVSTVIAATGKSLGREATSTRRVKMTASVPGSSLGAVESPIQSLEGMTVTGASGPHGVLTIKDFEGDTPLLGSLVSLTWIAKLMGEAGFAETVAHATGFDCVSDAATPASLTLTKGQLGSFTIAAHGLDDGRALPTSTNARVYSGNVTLSPVGNKLRDTGFQVTTAGGDGVEEAQAVTRRGYAPTLKIPVTERKGLPQRFEGTWTTTYTEGAWSEVIHGTATYVRDPLMPAVADDLIAVPYNLASVAITWSVAGIMTLNGCTIAYSGGGPATATDNTFVGTRLTLQATGGKFYYSIRASLDPVDAPTYTVTQSGGMGCNSSHEEPIVVNYLEIGDPHDLGPDTQPDLVQTTAVATQLDGHRVQTGTGFPPSESTWSFTGSY